MRPPIEFAPRAYQAPAIEFLKTTPRANLYADMGLGKTAIVLSMIEQLGLDQVLIIAPRRVALEVWPAEQHKWLPFVDLNVETLIGERALRERALLATPRVATINYDNLQWLIEACGEHWPFRDLVVADESSRLKGLRQRKGTKRTAKLTQIAHTKTERWVNLNGTPGGNGYLDLWGPQWFVDGGASLGRTFGAYKDRWFYRSPVKKGDYEKVKPLPGAEDEIRHRIRKTTMAIRAKDWFDLKEPFEHVVTVDLPPAARAQYKQMQRYFFAELETGTVTAANCGVKSAKLIQMASGAVYTGKEQWQQIHEEKLDALESIVTETVGANLLVVYQFRHEKELIKARFKRAVDIDAPAAINRWNAGEIPMLLVHPASAGHGLNLQDGGHHIVYFSPTWDLELYAQVLERIGPVRQMQSGYDRLVYVHHIIAAGTLDLVVKRRREEKGEVMECLLDAMRLDRKQTLR